MTLSQTLLMRHGHAEWPDWRGRDFDRPLTESGRAGARTAAKHLQGAGLVPAWVISSAARRTRETAEIVMAELALPHSVLQIESAAYNASPQTLGRLLTEAFEHLAEDAHVLVVAHNPGISMMVQQLAAQASENDAVASAHSLAPGSWWSLKQRFDLTL